MFSFLIENEKVQGENAAYILDKIIGKGKFATVKLSMKVPYPFLSKACKIVYSETLQNKIIYERFQHEIEISKLMNHPNVIKIDEIINKDNNYYILMEYCPKGNLLDYVIRNSRLSEDVAKTIMCQIFTGLQYIHSLNVSHRDLKLENILFDDDYNIKICDFGLSKILDENHLTNTPLGTPCYTSPECFSGNSYDGFKTDIWSCGVILYAMVTGFMPWTERNVNKLAEQINKGEYKIPEQISQECADLISKLLTIDPNKRISIEDAKKHIWFK